MIRRSEANRLGKVVAAPLADLVASAPPPETAQVPPPTEPALTGDAQRAVPGPVARVRLRRIRHRRCDKIADRL